MKKPGLHCEDAQDVPKGNKLHFSSAIMKCKMRGMAWPSCLIERHVFSRIRCSTCILDMEGYFRAAFTYLHEHNVCRITRLVTRK
jgi:hypothetical protein